MKQLKKSRFELRIEEETKKALEKAAEQRSIEMGKKITASELVHQAIKKIIKRYA